MGLLIQFVRQSNCRTNSKDLRFERGPAGLTSVITFKPVLIHWAVIGMSLLMVGVILIYAFVENFGPF